MTTCTASFTAIWIDPADTDVGPRTLIQFPIFGFHYTAVAIVTTQRTLQVIIHTVIQPWVNFPYQFKCICVLAAAVLFNFPGVT